MNPVHIFGAELPPLAIVGILGDDGAAIASELRKLTPKKHRLLPVIYALDALHPLRVLEARRDLMEAQRRGATVLLATWNEPLLEALADEIWWIQNGRILQQGDPHEILARWRVHIASRWRQLQSHRDTPLQPVSRTGDGRARILSVTLSGSTSPGIPVGGWLSGEEARIEVRLEFTAPVPDPVIGILLRTRIGVNVYGTNTELEQLRLGPRNAGDRLHLSFSFRCDLCPGEYTLTVASHDPDGVWHEWLEDVVAFTVADTRFTAGVANLRARVEWTVY